MSPAPITTVLLDVTETLLDLRPLDEWMHAHGLPAGSASAWLAAVLRDGFAASLAGLPAAFGPLGASALSDLAAEHVDAEAGQSLQRELPGVLAGLPAHDDVEPGIRSLIDARLGVATLTNGSPAIATGLLERVGLAGEGIGVISVDGTRTWKPHAGAYLGACDRLGVMPEQAALVASHPWDVMGAQRAGLQGVWLPRGRSWPADYPAPDRTISHLSEAAG